MDLPSFGITVVSLILAIVTFIYAKDVNKFVRYGMGLISILLTMSFVYMVMLPLLFPDGQPSLPTEISQMTTSFPTTISTLVPPTNTSMAPTNTSMPAISISTPTPAPPVPTPTPPTQAVCGGAVEIGPWLPIGGQGQDITIDSGDSFVHADFWAPNRILKEGCDEVSVLIEPGVRVTVLGVAGQAWEYGPGCSREYVIGQIEAHQRNRAQLEGKRMCMANLSELQIR